MMKNPIMSREDLFTEVVERGRQEGVTDQSAYNVLVENLLEDHRRLNEIDSDQDINSIREALQGRFEVYKQQTGF